MKKIVSTLKYKLHKWWNNLWFNKMSREFAITIDCVCQHGVDFGDEPLKNLLKYWCRDTRKTWHRFFINWKQYDKELEHIAFIRSYE